MSAGDGLDAGRRHGSMFGSARAFPQWGRTHAGRRYGCRIPRAYKVEEPQRAFAR
jgi:hypothetical protein